ncbi:MAG: NAD(P)-dependent oxidoreductase, partial [Opitutaceae bacterium]
MRHATDSAGMNLRGVGVLVTGGSGFVGSRIAAWLAAQGADVRAVVRKRGPHPGLDSPNITQVEGDFSDPLMARYACGGRELVLHAAATIGKDFSEALHINVTGTAVLAGAARKAGCQRFIHLSTLSVYDFSSGRKAFGEDSPLRQLGKDYAHSPAASPHYGTTKAEAERALQVEMKDGLPATIFRMGAVLGVHPTSSWAIKVPAKVRVGKVRVLGDGSDIIPWTHVDNVTHAIGLALDKSESIGRA